MRRSPGIDIRDLIGNLLTNRLSRRLAQEHVKTPTESHTWFQPRAFQHAQMGQVQATSKATCVVRPEGEPDGCFLNGSGA